MSAHPKYIVLKLLIISSVSISVHANEVGVYGETWPIKEKSMLSLIKEKAKNLDTKEMHKRWAEKARTYSDSPKALELGRARITSEHTYVPMVNVSQDITDTHGNIFAVEGTSINVLSRLPFYKPQLIFIDGRDIAQMKWAHRKVTTHPNVKVILTGGSVNKASKALNTTIFFDQGAVITKKFMIKSVPAYVYRNGLELKIEELAIKENGYER